MHHIDIIAKLISENIDDLDYDGPEEAEEFEQPDYFDDDTYGDEGETPDFDEDL
jgi:hypothetical protein